MSTRTLLPFVPPSLPSSSYLRYRIFFPMPCPSLLNSKPLFPPSPMSPCACSSHGTITHSPPRYMSFEVTIMDDKGVKRRFRASNFQSATRVKPYICTMPLRLDDGWNHVQMNLVEFCKKAYGTNYVETLRIQVWAVCCDMP